MRPRGSIGDESGWHGDETTAIERGQERALTQLARVAAKGLARLAESIAGNLLADLEQPRRIHCRSKKTAVRPFAHKPRHKRRDGCQRISAI